MCDIMEVDTTKFRMYISIDYSSSMIGIFPASLDEHQPVLSQTKNASCATTPNMIFSVTYYLDLHGATSFHYRSTFLPSKIVNAL